MDRSLARVMRLLEQLFDGEFEDLLEVARPRPRRPSSRRGPLSTDVFPANGRANLAGL
jgi:hypothetical protein